MLVVFRAGPKGDQTLDVIDVIPREIEARVRENGLGAKEKAYFWVEVDDIGLTDEQAIELARELTEPELEEKPTPVHPDKTPVKTYKVKQKRRKRLTQKRLEKLDPDFSASTATRTKDASKLYPKRKLTIKQLKGCIRDKVTGKHLDGD